MSNNYFIFKQFAVNQDRAGFKVGTDGVLLGALAETEGKSSILDIGTGTGLIALMLAQRSDAAITAIEPDPGSFSQACDNIRASRWADRIRIEKCTLQNFRSPVSKFDLIVTNPPYFIDSLRNPDSAKSMARHNITLTHKDVLDGAERLLEPEGTLQLILPCAEGNIFITEAMSCGFYCNRKVNIKPSPSSEIIRLIMSFSRERGEVTESILIIETGKRHDFTKEYRELTKEFYLKF